MSLHKEAQSGFVASSFSPDLNDLMNAIREDWSLQEAHKTALLLKIQQETAGRSSYTPLKDLLSTVFGGILGSLITKYFGMGIVGRTVATAVGAGLGSMIYSRLHPRDQWSYQGL